MGGKRWGEWEVGRKKREREMMMTLILEIFQACSVCEYSPPSPCVWPSTGATQHSPLMIVIAVVMIVIGYGYGGDFHDGSGGAGSDGVGGDGDGVILVVIVSLLVDARVGKVKTESAVRSRVLTVMSWTQVLLRGWCK